MNDRDIIALPIKFHYHHFDTRPHSSLSETGVHVNLEEFWEFINDPAFVTDEDAVLHLDLDDCRTLNGYYVLLIMAQSVPTTRVFIETLQAAGIRITTKDQRSGMDRMLWRAQVALLKPHIMERHLEVQERVLITHDIRKTFEGKEEPDALWKRVKDTLGADNPDDEAVRGGILYSLLFLMNDREMVDRWLDWAVTNLDPTYEHLQSTLSLGLGVYFRTRAEVEKRGESERESVSHADEIEKLRVELKQLQEQYQHDVDTLLSVINTLEEKRRKPTLPAYIQEENPLQNKRVLVIGDEAHATTYRTLVQAKGAVFDFLPGFDKDKATASKLAAADGIVFITAYSSHLKYFALKSADRCSVMVNQAGLGAFAAGLDKLADALRGERKPIRINE